MKKQLLIIVSVALAFFLLGTMFSTNYLATAGKPPSVWDAIYDLQAKVNSLNNTVIEQQALIAELQTRIDSIEIISVSVYDGPTVFHLDISLRNNGFRGEYLLGRVIFYNVDGVRLVSIENGVWSKMILPDEVFTLQGVVYSLEWGEPHTLEVWTYDGDSAKGYVELPA